MMEGHNGNSSPHKTTENGFKRKPPYSVETPYGFCLDLDFLKYVDDIEKGNTIKRVPIQRRSKGPRSSTLPRHLNLSGGSYRPSPWGSTGALGPRSRLLEANHGYSSWAYDSRTPGSPTSFKSLTEMEARIKAFDEQPLGEHIRPNLLRASSLPLTVLLRQSSESTEDPGSRRSSRDHLGGRDTSFEDVGHLPEFSGLLRRLTEALERIGELEMELRVIPELKAQICILQEERERLYLGLHPAALPDLRNGTKDSSWSHGIRGLKRQSNGGVAFPHKNQDDDNPLHEWRSSTDLDELLTVTSLQAKVAALEQKLHDNSLELQRTLGVLRELQAQNRGKDEKIEHLTRNPMIWVHAEKVAVDQDGREKETVSSTDSYTSANQTKACSLDGLNESTGGATAFTNGQRHPEQVVDLIDTCTPIRRSSMPMELEEASAEGRDSAAAVHRIRRIRTLLEQQWECLSGGRGCREEGKPLQHPDPKVNSIQKEMVDLVDALSSWYGPHGHLDQKKAPKSMLKTDDSPRMSKTIHFAGVNEGCETVSEVSRRCVCQGDLPEQNDGQTPPREVAEAQIRPKEVAAAQICPKEVAAAQAQAKDSKGGRSEREERFSSPCRTTLSGKVESGRADGGVASMVLGKEDQMEPSAQGEQMETESGSVSTTSGREAVSGEFMAACQFLKDHMDNMDNPNNDMRKALVVLFHTWFGVAAEEISAASRVALYLGEVKNTTSSLLAFLVNLADDNGNTALHYSLSHCNYSIVSQLLDTGVGEVDLQNKAGYTAVMLASLTAPDGPDGMDVVRRLMEMADVNIRSNQTGQTALHLAVRHGRVVMVRLLLSCGAHADTQDHQGTTALMFACERGHTHIARLLLERCHCDLSLTDKRGRTALALAVQGCHSDTASLLQAHAKARAL